MISKCISFFVLLFSWPVGGQGGEANLSGYQNFKMLPTIDTFLSKGYRGEGPWGLAEDRFSKEANRNPLHHSEGKVNFQSLRAVSHKKKTAEETRVSINVTSFLEFWSSESSPHLPLMFNFMATRWLQKSSAVLPEVIKHDNNTALTLSIMRNLGFLGIWDSAYFSSFFNELQTLTNLFFSSLFRWF